MQRTGHLSNLGWAKFWAPYLRKFGIAFLDDILVFSRTWGGHVLVEHVHAFLDAILRDQL